MDLHALILHSIQKKSGETGTNAQFRSEVIEKDDLAMDFADSILDAYKNKRSYQYSIFNESEIRFPFQKLMREYLDEIDEEEGDSKNDEGKKDQSFVDFSKESAKLLDDEMQKKVGATGGYAVFVHLTDDGTEYVFCLMVEDTDGFGVDESLGLTEQVHLDVADLQIASRINIPDWRNDGEGYVSFIPGKKDVSEYFKAFIGVKESDSGLKATRKAKHAMNAYMEEHDYKTEKRGEVTDLVVAYFRRAKKDGEAATIDAVANLVDPENKDRFLDHATSDEYRVNATFAPTPKGIREIEKYEVSGDDFNVRFDKKLFRKQVEYKSKEGDLVIHNVTPDMLSEDLRRASDADVE